MPIFITRDDKAHFDPQANIGHLTSVIPACRQAGAKLHPSTFILHPSLTPFTQAKSKPTVFFLY